MNSRKKIAILTLPLGHNYGGIMQNFALQRVLKNLGHDPLTIDRRNPPAQLGLWRRIKIVLKSLIGRDQTARVAARRRAKALVNNTSFIQKYIKTSIPVSSRKALRAYANKNTFDIYIVGSDQVWRPQYAPYIYNYYFDFLEDQIVKRVAYGASFGTDAWEYDADQTRRVAALIQKFDSISVREKSGVKLCKEKLAAKHVDFVLDPTLLLTASEYVSTFGIRLEKKELYTYILDASPDKQQIIDHCCGKLGLAEYSSQPRKDISSLDFRKPLSDYYMPPIENWISGFACADFVVTDSFHGMVFSIIFNVPFIVILNKQRGESRFRSLLEYLGLSSRLVYSLDGAIDELIDQPINYNDVNVKLAVLKHHSLNVLKRSIC